MHQPRHLLAAAVLICGGSAVAQTPSTHPAERAPPTSHGQGLDEPRTVDEFRLLGLRDLEEAAVLFHLGLAKGMAADAQLLDRALRDLWATGLVDRVELTLEPAGATGNVLVVAIEERPRLVGLRYEGVDAITRSQVARWITENDLRPVLGTTVDRPGLERLENEIEAFLATVDRPRRVAYRLEIERPGTVSAVFSFAPPERSGLIADIVFAGARSISTRDLRRAMKSNKQAGLGSRLTGRGRLDTAGLTADLERVRRLYRDRGYKDVVVGEPRIESQGPVDPKDPATERLVLTIPIEEGRLWSLAGLSVAGNRVFSDQALLALFERRGDRLSQSAVERWIEAIRGRYESAGRIDTRVDLEQRERPGGHVELRARVVEAPAVRLGRLEIVGNTRTTDPVLRRELGVDEGQVLDLEAMRRGLAAIEARAIFDFHDEPLRLARRTTAPEVVDLTLDGREADPFRVNFGGGWSRSEGLSGHLTFAARNLFGTGTSAGLRFVEGDLRDQLEVFFVQPRLGGRRQTLSAELFDRDSSYSLPRDQRFSRHERGLQVAWSRPLGPRKGTRLFLRLSSLDDLQAMAGVPVEPGPLAADRHSLGWSWSYDSRDDPLQPRRGLTARTTVTASGGDHQLLETRASLSTYRPLGQLGVFAARLEGGRFEPLDGAPSSPLDAFFLGGPRSLRGFATGSVVARDSSDEILLDDSGFAVGGNRYLEAGLECRLRLRGPFGAALFLDAGNVWAPGQPLDLESVRTSAGAELWLTLPRLGLPLRLVWAHNLDPLPLDDFDSFLLSFGTSF